LAKAHSNSGFTSPIGSRRNFTRPAEKAGGGLAHRPEGLGIHIFGGRLLKVIVLLGICLERPGIDFDADFGLAARAEMRPDEDVGHRVGH
jgi:hypothetical protein